MADDLKVIKRCVFLVFNRFDFEKKELNAKPLKELKLMVRKNEAIIQPFVDVLFAHLRRENSDSRLAILLLVNYFFQRSHKFRLEVVNSLQDFALLTLETDPLHFPLPRPAAAALALKKEALETIRCWVEKFGPGYPKLKNAERFLETSKNFDFKRSNAELLVERNRLEQERFNREVMARKVFEKCQKLSDENFDDIQKCLTECRNLLEILFPKFYDSNALDELQKNDSSSSTSTISLNQLHGYSAESVVNVVIPAGFKIPRSKENEDLLNSLKDCRVQLESYLCRVTKWLKKISEVGPIGDTPSTSANSSMPSLTALTRRLIGVKGDLKAEIERCRKLSTSETPKYDGDIQLQLPKFFTKKKRRGDENDSGVDDATLDKGDDSGVEDDDDADFIDVEEKEGLELDFAGHEEDSVDDAIPKHIIDKIRQNEMEAKAANRAGPSGLQTTTTKRDSGISVTPPDDELASTSKNGVANAEKVMPPKLAFGLDLKYWGQNVEPAAIVRNQFDGHRFWRAPETEEESTRESEETYSTRLMTFIGEMPTISRICRAPLANGKLCPRMDRNRCPVHGPIIDRDATGRSTNVVDEPAASNSKLSGKSKRGEPQNFASVLGDEEFLRDVGGATGFQLDPATRRRGGNYSPPKKRKVPAGAQLRQRLETKLLDRRTVRRVTQAMDDMQKARAERKFAHQFNYALNNHRS